MTAPPIRVLHLIASNFVGGPEKQILHHALDLRALGIEVVIGSFRDQANRADILQQAEEHALPTFEIFTTGRFDFSPVGKLTSFLKQERIDVLCTHGYKANVFGALAKKLAGVPQVAFCRGWTAETTAIRVYEFLDRRALLVADRIVCVSQAQGKVLARNPFLRRKISVVQNAVLDPICAVSNDERAQRKLDLGFSADTRLIGAVGRLSTEKGQRYLVEAAAELRAEFPDLKIALLGEGRDRPSLEARIAELGLKDMFLLPGFQKNVASWMRALDALVNCSLTEGLPNVVLEAMAAGTPVVATEVGGVPELIENGKTGVLVPAADAASLARGVASVLRHRDYGVALGEAGRMWVAEHFSPAQQQKSLLEVYTKCVGRTVSATTRESEGPATSVTPFISVVIPVRNEERHLGAVLDGLLAQNYPKDRYEILVADGSSTDRTLQVVEEIAKNATVRIQSLSNPRQLSSAGRNAGVRASRGDLIVFIDGHCHLASGELLADTARLFTETGADCLCRPQPLTAPGGTPMQKIVADVRASRIGHGLDSTIYAQGREGFIDPTSSGASYRRAVFANIGEYDEGLDACEDVEFNYRVHRAGLRAFTSPRLTVQYHARGTLSGLWKQMVRYGRGRYRFVQRHPEAFSVGQAIPPLFVIWLLFGGIAALVWNALALPFLFSVALYAGVVLGSSVALGIKHGWRHLAVAPAVYAIVHVGLGMGFLAEAARSRNAKSNPSVAMHSSTMHDNEASSEPTRNRLSISGAATLNAFSIDVEDYFHTEAMSAVVSREQWDKMPARVEANTRRLYELLSKHEVRATFFFLGWVAERFPSLVREAVALGHEIGCHSYWHRRVYTLDPEEFRADTLRAKQVIEDAGGVPVRGYRAPSFSIVQGTEWALDVLMELGFAYDSSSNPVRHDLYNNAGAPRLPHYPGGRNILELPVTTTKLAGNVFPIAGGGYTRILPYAYTHWGLSRFIRQEARPAIMYFHPWEIDAQQPRLPASAKSRFRQYTGLATTENKLSRLLEQFAFAPIATVFEKELRETAARKAIHTQDPQKSAALSHEKEEACVDADARTGGAKWSG